MNRTLYDEAIADAQKLRELAEETAKNKVIDAVMPQIRDLVNKRIMGENLEDFSEEELVPLEDSSPIEDVDISSVPEEIPSGETEVEVGPEIEIQAQGDVNINLSSDDESDLVLDDKMSEALRRLIKGETTPKKSNSLFERVDRLHAQVQKLSEVLRSIKSSDLTASQRKRLNLSFLYCIRESIKLRSEVIITEGKTQERLERRLTEIIKEIKNMSKSNRRNIFDFLFEAEDEKKSMEELEEAELSLELTDEEQEELAVAEDPEAVSGALEDILGDLEVSMETGGDLEDAEGEDLEGGEEAAGDLEAEPAEDLGGEEEVDLEELDYSEGADLEESYEIDERMLRRELARMMTENEAADADPAANNGGEVLGDVLLDIDEEDLINALADEIGDTDVPSNPPTDFVESRRRRGRRVSRTRGSVLSQRLAESRKQVRQYKQAVHNLKTQLVEMNLFNAKLLYANKLMQNTNLTMKQQKAIVEALDNAKTLREAKLLYKSLTESLNRKSSKKLTEGSLRTLGSSSRSTRSAQPASNGVEVDRWGVLAGLTGKD